MARVGAARWRGDLRVRRPERAALRSWLQAPGSLTGHLRRAFGAVAVLRLYQGPGVARADEAAVLGIRAGLRVHVREVMLVCAGQPMVLARSVTEARHLRGAWKALKGLGTRPLAELLFHDRRVRREPMSYSVGAVCRVSTPPARGRATARPMEVPQAAPKAAPTGARMWQRRSVFVRRSAKLLVSEMFLDSPRIDGGRGAGQPGFGPYFREKPTGLGQRGVVGRLKGRKRAR